MMSHLRSFLLLVGGLLLSWHAALVWGTGHVYQMELVLDRLNPRLGNFFPPEQRDQIIKEYAGVPDAALVLDETKVVLEAAALLKQFGIKSTSDLHSDRGKAVAFILLTRAFAERNRDQAGLWMGSLIHSIADEAACNHDPLIHVLTYAFGAKEYRIKMGKGVGMDLGDLATTPEGRTLMTEMLKDYQPVLLSQDPARTLITLMMTTVQGNDWMTQRGAAIAASYAIHPNLHAQEDGRLALAELGMWSTRIAGDAVWTAWRYAQEGKSIPLTEAILQQYAQERAEFLEHRPLERDSIYGDLLNVGQSPIDIGVPLEPSQSLNDCRFSFGAKYLLSAIMRELRINALPYRPIDVRKVSSATMPSPEKMPVLVVCAGGFRVPATVLQGVKDYAQAGGKLLWIAGQHPGFMGELSHSLATMEERLMPVSNKYGAANPLITQLDKINFQGEFAAVLGQDDYSFQRNPNTAAGWQKPRCSFQVISRDPRVKPLAQLLVEGKTMTIAATLVDGNGRPRHVFLPEYLIAPYLLSKEDQLEDPSKPVLDQVGKRLVKAAMKMLVPDLAQKD